MPETIGVIPCSCGGIPEASVYRLAEDLMGAKATCPKCGLESDEIEHVWGGADAKLMAYEEWNHMRRTEPDKKPIKRCGACGNEIPTGATDCAGPHPWDEAGFDGGSP